MKRISLYIILLIFSTLAQAQVLYEVSGNSTSAKSYILATNKYVNYEFLDSIPNLFKVYSRCNKLVVETAMNDYEALATLRTVALLPDSVRLQNYYNELEYKQIDDALSIALGMGMQELGRMKPAYLTELYRNRLMEQWLQYTPDQSMEIFFPLIAEDTKQPIYHLDEITEAFYMLFDREPLHWQCEELQHIVEYPEREVNLERQILQAYKNGHLNQIAYLLTMPDNKSTHSYSDYQVYARRNTQWVKRLRPYLKEGKAFICLDANYLGGDEGLLQQLRSAGYRIRPVNRK